MESYGPKGALLSDDRFANWQPLETSTAGIPEYPRSIRIDRPHDEYQLNMTITKIAVNETIEADRFNLQPPAGAELVRVGDSAGDKKP